MFQRKFQGLQRDSLEGFRGLQRLKGAPEGSIWFQKKGSRGFQRAPVGPFVFVYSLDSKVEGLREKTQECPVPDDTHLRFTADILLR